MVDSKENDKFDLGVKGLSRKVGRREEKCCLKDNSDFVEILITKIVRNVWHTLVRIYIEIMRVRGK